MVKAYSAWSPAAGSYAIGYHQVAGQSSNNFGPSATIAISGTPEISKGSSGPIVDPFSAGP